MPRTICRPIWLPMLRATLLAMASPTVWRDRPPPVLAARAPMRPLAAVAEPRSAGARASAARASSCSAFLFRIS